MEKNNSVVCPFCKCKESWFIQTTEAEKAFQCAECSRYFKVRVNSIYKAVKQSRGQGAEKLTG